MIWLKRSLPFLALGVAFAAMGQDPAIDAAVEAAADALENPEVATTSSRIPGMLISVALGAALLFTRRFSATLPLIAGLGFVFVGERLFGDGSMRWVLTGVGVVVLIASLGMRIQALLSETNTSRKNAQRYAIVTAAVTIASLMFYALSTSFATDALGLADESLSRWVVAFQALVPLVLVSGLFPTMFLDMVLSENPVMVPGAAPGRALRSGLSTAFALALLFPLNYIANADKYSTEADYSYFRVTGVGTRTMGVARSLSEPVTATLYFSGGSEVRARVEPYFTTLAGASNGLMTVQVVDNAVRPDLAEEHAIRDNGWVVLSTADSTQKFQIGTDLDRAKRKLAKLDATVTKHLLKLTSDAQVAYFLSGHGEASWRERDNPARKLSKFKRDLEDLNFRVETLGVTEGSAVAVPDDAALVVVAAPMIPLFEEEENTLIRYLEDGGALLLLLDPGAAQVPRVMDYLGLEAGEFPVANEAAHIVYTGGIADRILVATNRYGTHPATSTVSRNSARNPLALPTALSLKQSPSANDDITTLVRSYPDSWEDTNNNRQPDANEPTQVFDLAVAVEREEGFRAVVIGDVAVFSELAYDNMQANIDFAADVATWLVGEDQLIGQTEREEDVEIRHTRDDDKAWFWGTILGVPLLILAFGTLLVNVRRRKS